MLSREKRRAVAARAAEIMRLETITWVTGNWITDGGTDVGRSGSMSYVRNTIQSLGLGNSCGVCLEGALLLSLAQDNEIDNDDYASNLLEELYPDVRELDLSMYGINADELEEIPSLNDNYLGSKQDAIDVLERLARS